MRKGVKQEEESEYPETIHEIDDIWADAPQDAYIDISAGKPIVRIRTIGVRMRTLKEINNLQ